VRHAGLTNVVPGGCPDEYFYEAPATGCNIGVEAQLDLGGGLPADYTINAVVGNKKYLLAYNPTNAKWVSSELIPVTPAAGPVNISLDWKAGKNSGSLGMVARTFSASGARTGPIKQAAMFVDSAGGVSSVEQCDAVDCTHTLAVQLGLQGSFEDHFKDLLTQNDPVTLRFAGGDSGSQNQALDCDPWAEDPEIGGGTRGFRDEIAHGCRPSYAPNEGVACPAAPNDLWGTSSSPDDQGPAWQCVAVETGDRVNQVATGLNLRIHDDTNPDECEWPNNWNEDLRAPNDEDSGDPRIVHLFLTQFGAFATEGQNTVPVTNFATFYVTGWRGSGGADSPCQDDPPGDALPDDPVTESGTVVGHFMKYRGPLGNNTGTQPCNFDGPTPCVFALTR
jgi:hypothetical protein